MTFKKICEVCNKEQKRDPEKAIYKCKCGHITDISHIKSPEEKDQVYYVWNSAIDECIKALPEAEGCDNLGIVSKCTECNGCGYDRAIKEAKQNLLNLNK